MELFDEKKQREFEINSGNRCPYCGADYWHISAMSTLVWGPNNTTTYHCNNCGKEWTNKDFNTGEIHPLYMTDIKTRNIDQHEIDKIKKIIIKNSVEYRDYDDEFPSFIPDRVIDPDDLAEKLYKAGCRFIGTNATL